MGEYEKHIRMAREKLEAIRIAFEKRQHTVVGDLATNPDFSRVWATQEQARPPAKQGEAAWGISTRRCSILLRGLNNAVPVSLRLAFGEEF